MVLGCLSFIWRECCCCCKPGCCTDYYNTFYLPSCFFGGICSFPHGVCYTIMGVMMGFGGVYMNVYVLGTCFFNRITLINTATGEPIKGEERGYGFMGREQDYGIEPDYRQCAYYSPEEYEIVVDSWVYFASMFSYLSGILGFVAFMILFSTCCIAYSDTMYERWLLWTYLFAACCISLSMLAYGSEFCQANQCTVAQGTGWAITTLFFWLMAANTVKSMGGAMPPKKQRPRNYRNPNKDAVNDYDHEWEENDELYYENEADKYPEPPPRDDENEEFLNDYDEDEDDDIDSRGEYDDDYDDGGNSYPDQRGSYRGSQRGSQRGSYRGSQRGSYRGSQRSGYGDQQSYYDDGQQSYYDDGQQSYYDDGYGGQQQQGYYDDGQQQGYYDDGQQQGYYDDGQQQQGYYDDGQQGYYDDGSGQQQQYYGDDQQSYSTGPQFT